MFVMLVVEGLDYLLCIDSCVQFMQFVCVYNVGIVLEMLYLIFVIDWCNVVCIYYINILCIVLYEQFVCCQWLLLGMDKVMFNVQYCDLQWCFLFGMISWQQDLLGYIYEFWEGDQFIVFLLQQIDQVVCVLFCDFICFKINFIWYEQLVSIMKLFYVSQEVLLCEQCFLLLNIGCVEGWLCIVCFEQQLCMLLLCDILVLDEVLIVLVLVVGLVMQ